MKKQVKIKLTSREVEALKQILWDFTYHERSELRNYKVTYDDGHTPFDELNEIQKYDDMVVHYFQRRLAYGEEMLELFEKLKVSSDEEVVKDFCM